MSKQGKRTPDPIREFVVATKRNAPGLTDSLIADRVVAHFGPESGIDKSTVGRIRSAAGLPASTHLGSHAGRLRPKSPASKPQPNIASYAARIASVLENPRDMVDVIEVYKLELQGRVQVASDGTYRGLDFEGEELPYGPLQKKIIAAIRSRDVQLAQLEQRLEEALAGKRHTDAKEHLREIFNLLDRWAGL